jgi:hypothetical protein
VHLILFGDGDRLCHIPGTLTVSSNEDDGVIDKKITMSLPDVTEEFVDSLESYGGSLLVAVYSDERGRQRVCGSPDWPLTLSYSTDGGICAITLEGRDTRPDAFFAG